MQQYEIQQYFEQTSTSREKWKKKNRFYHRSLEKYCSLIIPPGERVLEVGCGLGDLLAAVKPSYGVGVDFAPTIIEKAQSKYPALTFIIANAEDFHVEEDFDYIILSDLLGSLADIQKVLHHIRKFCHSRTRLIITNFNYLWEPIMKLGETLGIKLRQPKQNWISAADLETFLYLEEFEVITTQKKILFPKYIPIFNFMFNTVFANLPLINSLNLIRISISRPFEISDKQCSVSIIIPARNEFGNIENAILRVPEFGLSQEYIFIDGPSKDNTYEEMMRVKAAYPHKNIKVIKQTGDGKGNAVQEGFDLATGEMLMILDADLTTPPEDLYKFYNGLIQNKGEFMNGCRLVYPMEKEAMRLLNYVGNKFFSLLFSYLLGQRLKDTLCGTKVLFKSDYERIKKNRSYFGDFDPFGDFDLLFGASKLNLKITEINVRYRDRSYGETQIKRFQHGWLLIKMSIFAFRKLKFK